VKYTLIALFLSTGQAYVERDGLSLQGCAARAAVARTQAAEVFQFVGKVQYLCVPNSLTAENMENR
jgi:hypothetical protein